MIVDEVKINVVAGKGGNGLATFSKVKLVLGPTGGNGGRGGNVLLEGCEDLSALKNFRFKKVFKANNGENGRSALHDGSSAKDLILKVPVGTICHIISEGKDISAKGGPAGGWEITKIGQQELVAKGGRGGKGNWHFRSATNTSPKESEEGKSGESFDLHLELKMIADVGFIGLPNAGKSSLLNELTRANVKVANYPFTTLEPNLGVYYGLILADIPGLIEGASDGRGLGIKFLKHIERTKNLFHIISSESLNPILDYQTVRQELKNYNELLLEKTETILLSKTDLINKNNIERIKRDFNKINKDITPISIIDEESIDKVKKALNNLIEEKTA